MTDGNVQEVAELNIKHDQGRVLTIYFGTGYSLENYFCKVILKKKYFQQLSTKKKKSLSFQCLSDFLMLKQE